MIKTTVTRIDDNGGKTRLGGRGEGERHGCQTANNVSRQTSRHDANLSVAARFLVWARR